MKFVFIVSILFFALTSFASKGESLYKKKLCISCHGPRGNKPLTGDYPKLLGQNYKYLVKQTKLIRDGKRKSGLSGTMKASIRKVSNKNIETISKWLSKLDVVSPNPAK